MNNGSSPPGTCPAGIIGADFIDRVINDDEIKMFVRQIPVFEQAVAGGVGGPRDIVDADGAAFC